MTEDMCMKYAKANRDLGVAAAVSCQAGRILKKWKPRLFEDIGFSLALRPPFIAALFASYFPCLGNHVWLWGSQYIRSLPSISMSRWDLDPVSSTCNSELIQVQAVIVEASPPYLPSGANPAFRQSPLTLRQHVTLRARERAE